MRMVFMGTPDFAVPCLRRVLEDGHQVAGVFTQPDKPQGRRMTLTPPPVKVLAQEWGIPVYQPTKLRDGTALALLRELDPQVIVVVAYGRILPVEILECPPLGCINIHGSLLPKYRGAAPIQWSVIRGDPVAGVTSMYMAQGMDTGDMILKVETPVGEDETAGELFDRLAPLGAQCLSDTLGLLEAGAAPRVPQREEEATPAPMLTKEMGEIAFARPARELHNLVRGTNPWPGAWLRVGEEVLKVHATRVVPGSGTPGTVLGEDGLRVACGRDALELVTVQRPGKNRVTGAEYRRGARLQAGSLLG